MQQQEEGIHQSQRDSKTDAVSAASLPELSMTPNPFSYLTCSNWSTALSLAIRPTPCNPSMPRNIIIAYEKESSGGASLSEQTWVMSEILKYASRLCARVLLPPPFMMLSSRENSRPLNCTWQWSRYWEWERLSFVVSNWKDVLPFAPGAKDDASDAHCTGTELDYKSLATAKRSDLDALHRLALSSAHMSAPNMPAAFQLFLEGKPFVYAMDTHTVFPKNKPCNLNDLKYFDYVPGLPSKFAFVKPAQVIEQLADSIMSAFDEQQFLLLYIRRSNTSNLTDACDSSPSQVRLFLNCAIGEYNGKLPAILLSTDEIDPVYLNETLTMLQEFTLRALNIEPFVQARLQGQRYDFSGDNIVMHAVIEAMQAAVDGKVSKGAKSMALTFGRKEFSSTMRNPREICEQQTHCERNFKATKATGHQFDSTTAVNSTIRKESKQLRQSLRG